MTKVNDRCLFVTPSSTKPKIDCDALLEVTSRYQQIPSIYIPGDDNNQEEQPNEIVKILEAIKASPFIY